MSYKGLDDEEELEMVPVINQNNYNKYDVGHDSESKKDDEENLLNEDVNKEFKATPMTTINTKVIHVIKKLQALYNDDANKILEEAAQERNKI